MPIDHRRWSQSLAHRVNRLNATPEQINLWARQHLMAYGVHAVRMERSAQRARDELGVTNHTPIFCVLREGHLVLARLRRPGDQVVFKVVSGTDNQPVIHGSELSMRIWLMRSDDDVDLIVDHKLARRLPTNEHGGHTDAGT